MTVWVMEDMYHGVNRVFKNKDKAKKEAKKIIREWAKDANYTEEDFEYLLSEFESEGYLEELIAMEEIELE